MQTIWLSPTNFVSGDPTLRVSYPFVSHPSTIVSCTAPGDFKWVSMGLRLPPDAQIEDVIICYQVSNTSSFIKQVRLAEMTTPDHVTVIHDDPTPLTSTAPTSYTSGVPGLVPSGAVTLELRLNFQNPGDQILLGAVGINIQSATGRCVNSVADLRALAPGAFRCAELLGYYAPGDGGGGEFYWDASATEPNNGGTVIQPASNSPTGRWKRSVEGPINVKWFGAKGDAITPDDATINAAALATKAAGAMLYFPAGATFLIDSTVNLNCNVDGYGANLITSTTNISDFTAILVGVTGIPTVSIKMNLPNVIDKTNSGFNWSASKRIGVECRNLADCEIHFGQIWNFTIGAYLTGAGGDNKNNGGNFNNQYFISALINNKVNMQLEPIDEYGWCNENIFYGGDYQFSDDITTHGTDVSGTRQIKIVQFGLGSNSNLFIKPDLEANAPEYHVECQGSYNMWLHARWETSAVPPDTSAKPPKVWFNSVTPSSSNHNIIQYGYNADLIVVTGDGVNNTIIGVEGTRGEGEAPGGSIIYSNDSSDGYPTYVVMPAVKNGWLTSLNPVTDYAVAISAARSAYKYYTHDDQGQFVPDTNPRINLDHVYGSIFFGLGGTYPCTSKCGLDPSTGFLNFYGLYGTNIAQTGGTLSFYGAKQQLQQARSGQLVDNSGGTATDTIAAIPSTYNQSELGNTIASLTAKINALEAIVHNLGLSD